MKRSVIFGLALLCTCMLAAQNKQQESKNIIGELGRTVIAVNDQASMMAAPDPAKPLEIVIATCDMPVVFERTVQAMYAGYVSIFWRDLRADRDLSPGLSGDCSDYKLAKVFQDNVMRSLSAVSVTIMDEPPARAVFNRARIAHPVKFADDPTKQSLPISFKKSMAGSSRHYDDWEKAVASDLKKGNLADSLLVVNVFLWGLRPGGSKLEQGSQEDKTERYWKTHDFANIFSSRTAQVAILLETRLIDVKTGKLVWNKQSSYSATDKDLTSERLMDGKSLRFKHYTTCLVEWYAHNLVLDLSAKPELEEWQCREITEL